MNIKKLFYKYLSFHSFLINKNNYNNTKLNNLFRGKNIMSHIKPNYFICIPLNDKKVILNELLNIQKFVVSKCDILNECIIEKEKFHISLLILYVKNKTQIDLSKEAFNEAITEIKKINKKNLYFKNLDTFHNDVLYLSLKEESNDYIILLANIFRKSFEKRNIKIVYNSRKHVNSQKREQNDDDKNGETYDCKNKITPHLTLMKNSHLSRIYMNRKPKIFPDYYSDFNLTKLLTEHITPNKIQLLEMDVDSTTSYYKIVSEFSFS
ncbi:conserved Plasmodium protein, unknown function [Plasmodium berghei]|uniref:AKAP-like protein, putative n=2 Tax=Plasmodium berghei TaxID=5821 RepID=A0A509AKE6_PLABA|nr:AKAP-like protein, putative [Plasmodium berghei ANKA]CXI61925.1 conserved Plasmodium protein, unknown function [Plasmodium berghei]SCM23673.1 conserved Plasmodium protein, unknown function [Plasmodium berghei]SCN26717.1 conserved Plasmodium protein, unknown function [Plasmodium berghei]SCO61019.1 conserved Plasmodium protein, unknown function [Plasmodium berghei]SCO63129.1 conserved Plasmodium protein, unknown function [Plasmodium berghei]|eukprot:XP_034422333.1 AKAP-like protein, putative [Plasmodium berghei ANKA]